MPAHFITTDDGWVNLAHVAKVTEAFAPAGLRRFLLHDRDGKILDVVTTDGEPFDLGALTAPGVPGVPGARRQKVRGPRK